MYPSPAELFTEVSLPKALLDDLRQRYAEHGPEYLLDEQHEDGRRLNACMHANSAQDALEEVTDAVFNLAVLRLKGYRVGHMLAQAEALWTDLERMRDWINDEGV